MALRVVFFGTPSFAVPTLDALHDSPHTIVAVVTQPDRPRGRGHKVTASAVKARALEMGTPVLQPDRMKDPEFLDALRELAPDIGVVAAYGRILPTVLLELPRLGLLNVHASLLPRWRGAAPVHRAILAGDAETGVTIMRVVLALDAGPMLARVTTRIDRDETSGGLEGRLASLGAPLLVNAVEQIAAGTSVESAQDERLVTYAARLERADSLVDWAQPAATVHNRIRGLQPWPQVEAWIGGKRVLLRRSQVRDDGETHAAPGTIVGLEADAIVIATALGTIGLTEIQMEGRPPVAVRAFLNGHTLRVGEQFASTATAAL
jgi:methionyl-tRNA formyltransferase